MYLTDTSCAFCKWIGWFMMDFLFASVGGVVYAVAMDGVCLCTNRCVSKKLGFEWALFDNLHLRCLQR